MNQKFSTEPYQQRVEKPWGHEIIYAPPGLPYVGKVLHVTAGQRSSIHYHDQKLETLCLISGQAILWLELENSAGDLQKIPMQLLHGYTLAVGQKHRYEAIGEDADILEASQPETGTTVRLEDDAARPDETEELRRQVNRGWTKS